MNTKCVLFCVVVSVFLFLCDRQCSCAKILSRKRRYLTFPEGSSLQVVYDQTLPTEAVPLVFTVGVTVAIAYELPSKPWYELAKQIKENIRNGEYLLKKDENVTQLSYVDTQVAKNEFLGQTNNLLQQQAPVSSAAWTKHSYYYKDKPSYYKQPVNYYSNPLTKTVQPISNKMDYYFGNQNKNQYNFGKWANQLSSWTNKYLTSKPGQTKSPIYWSDVIKKLSQPANRRQDIPNSVKQNVAYSKYLYQTKHKRPITPIFGKRSTDQQELEERFVKAEQMLFRRHHRKSRHDLYSKIEIYLNAKGLNGRKCVLRTLCETGHMETSKTLPNTFMAEIIKSIFKLPSMNDDPETVDVHRVYDQAHSSNGNCTDLYPDCAANLWTSHFLY